MGFVFAFILILLCGIASIVFSILAWRLKSQVFFILGTSVLAIYLIIFFINIEYNLDIILSGNMIMILIDLAFIGLPLFFLIKSQTDKPNSSFDGGQGGGAVTEEYLDEIINAPDEEIDFEEDLD